VSRTRTLSRRRFLTLSAMTAASAAIAACGGGQPAQAPTSAPAATAAPAPTSAPAPTVAIPPTTPPQATAVPQAVSRFKESPELAKLVAEGKLPPVDQRLPKNPYVVPHKWLSVGKYGGTLNFTKLVGTRWYGDDCAGEPVRSLDPALA